jgi:predicted regulator of Ras-like GTPase activity (Roadblock/LC7/MglB family)
LRRPLLDPALAERALEVLSALDGLYACAVVDASSGLILAKQERKDQPVDLDLAAAASAQLLRTHQHVARQLGLTTEIDEVMTSAGPRHHVMRNAARHKGLFLFAVLDKQRTNLALARYKLMEAEQSLG